MHDAARACNQGIPCCAPVSCTSQELEPDRESWACHRGLFPRAFPSILSCNFSKYDRMFGSYHSIGCLARDVWRSDAPSIFCVWASQMSGDPSEIPLSSLTIEKELSRGAEGVVSTAIYAGVRVCVSRCAPPSHPAAPASLFDCLTVSTLLSFSALTLLHRRDGRCTTCLPTVRITGD